MKYAIWIFALISYAAIAQEDVSIEDQSNLKAEMQILATGEKIGKARDEVIKSIDEIQDQKKKDLCKLLFAKNEAAWDNFIGTTALLKQPIKDSSTQPDVRYTRVLVAEYSEFRIKQYQDFVIWMKQNKMG